MLEATTTTEKKINNNPANERDGMKSNFEIKISTNFLYFLLKKFRIHIYMFQSPKYKFFFNFNRDKVFLVVKYH